MKKRALASAMLIFCLSLFFRSQGYSELFGHRSDKSFLAKAFYLGNSLHTEWVQPYGRSIERQNNFNQAISSAVAEWEMMDPLILKSILAQESGLHPKKRNRHGYTGISQLGRREARSAGLRTGQNDERYEPDKAIRACVKVLKKKSKYLHNRGFSKYGVPEADEYWKFVAAAYNAGEGTIARAMNLAYKGKRPNTIRFEDLLYSASGNYRDTPLYRALPSHFRKKSKYKEIREYAFHVVSRARQ